MNTYNDPLCPSQKKNSSPHPQRELWRNGNAIYARKYSIAGIYAVITNCWSIASRVGLQQVQHRPIMDSIYEQQLQNDTFQQVQRYLSYKNIKQFILEFRYLLIISLIWIPDTTSGTIEEHGCRLYDRSESTIAVSKNSTNQENAISYFFIRIIEFE